MNQAALDSVSLRVQAEQIADTYSPQSYGRPALLEDPDKVQLLLASLRDGNYREIACRQAGIAKQTLYNWLNRAEAGDEGAIRFVDALEKAEADAEAELVGMVRKAGKFPQFWAAAATQLERKHPDRWGRRPEDSSAPRVIVQVGGNASDVKVLIQAGETPLSPSTFALDEGRKVDANLLSDKTYASPSCPISAVMVTSPESVPTGQDVTISPASGAGFAGATPVEEGAPQRAEFSSVKASPVKRRGLKTRGPAAKDVRARRRKPRSRGGKSGLASRLAAEARREEKRVVKAQATI